MKNKTKIITDTMFREIIKPMMINYTKTGIKFGLEKITKNYFTEELIFTRNEFEEISFILEDKLNINIPYSNYNTNNLKEMGDPFLFYKNTNFLKYSKKQNVFINIKVIEFSSGSDIRMEYNRFSYLLTIIGNKNKCEKILNYIINNKIIKKDHIKYAGSKRLIKVSHDEIKNKDLYTSKHKEDILNKIRNHINMYSSEEKVEYNRGISFLLYGKHGTGKTSIINSITINFKDKIESIQVINSINDIENSICETEYIYDIIKYEPFKKYHIILIDEIDLIIKNNDGKVDNEKLRKILNILSNSVKNNIILIMTTNNIQDLPESLLRTGRCDFKYEITDFNEQEIQEYLSKRNILKEDIERLVKDENGNYITIGNSINPAYLNELCRSYRRIVRNEKY